MDNNLNNQPNISAPVPPVSPTAPVTAIPKARINPQFTELINKFKAKIPQDPKKFLIKLAVIFIIIVFLLVVISLISRFMMQRSPQIVATPTPTPPVVEQEPINPSVYANDPEVLKIEEDIKKFEEELNKTDLREDNLRIPNMDWNVTF